MDDVLTIEQIEARYAPHWALIGEPQVDPEQRLLGGRALFHGSDRDEVYRKAREMPLDRIAVRYLGSWPEGMTFVL